MDLNTIANGLASLVDGIYSKEVAIALIAAYIGARATRKATIKAHEYAAEKSAQDEVRLTKNTLLLLSVELTTAWELYKEEYGNELLELETSEPYICYFSIGANTFPIFDSAPSHLANINPDLSSKIVRIYMRMKGLISMIEINNSDFDAAIKAGNEAVERMMKKANEEEKTLSEEAIERLDIYRENYITLEAKKIDMGSTADGIKSLTHELQDLIDATNKEIEKY
ncbi:MAG: hypothetical protein ACRESJ_15270 [Pseudomonas sp.]|uniref:hypothetical protein n=1 Tax=Pseudomonas sp. TaxID=306 RepID=UPI003D6E5951